MADGGESRAAWLDEILCRLELDQLEIRCDGDADLGLYGYAVCDLSGGVLASGPTINDALVEFDHKHMKTSS